MRIKKLHIENFKCFKGEFTFTLNDGLNVLVGDNETGKSTILEAIHLALTGMLNGRYLKNEITQYLFNREVIEEYVDSEDKANIELPRLLIEVYLEEDSYALFEGDDNSERAKNCGFYFTIEFDEQYQTEYEELVKTEEGEKIKTIPIEYYHMQWKSFAWDTITTRSIPLKSALIDSSSNRYKNSSDVYISRIIKDLLEPKEVIGISQAHRKMKESFMKDQSIEEINKKIKTSAKISHKEVTLSVELPTKHAWEDTLLTYLDDIPFHYVGKGEQCIVKTKLALAHKKSQQANILLLEEPENHLSHTRLNQLIFDIKNGHGEKNKQVLISTHSSFVANKLGLEHLLLLSNQQIARLQDLEADTQRFFEKLPGYDTLRLILCKKAILVEGDSDELIIQKAYKDQNAEGRLPIEDGIDVISVGTSFLRFLEIAVKLGIEVAVVTDNDGDVDALKTKYADYLSGAYPNIKICFDETIDSGDDIKDKPFNYNTLEPKMLKENNIEKFNNVFGTNFSDVKDMHVHMRSNKTECALKLFDTTETLDYPQYILDAIN